MLSLVCKIVAARKRSRRCTYFIIAQAIRKFASKIPYFGSELSTATHAHTHSLIHFRRVMCGVGLKTMASGGTAKRSTVAECSLFYVLGVKMKQNSIRHLWSHLVACSEFWTEKVQVFSTNTKIRCACNRAPFRTSTSPHSAFSIIIAVDVVEH